jgi:Uncharacterized conserved protein, contains double-stranded beta-helix domain
MNLNRRSLIQGAAFGGTALLIARDVFAEEAIAPVTGELADLFATGELPGKQRLYALRNGQGEFHLVGGQVATLIARGQDSDGLFEAAILTGAKGATIPLHVHEATDEAFFVLDGKVELWLDGKSHLLSRGDYAAVPAGTQHGHVMHSWRTRIVTWTTGSRVGAMYPALGEPFSRPVQPETVDNAIPAVKLQAAEAVADVKFIADAPTFGPPQIVTASELPTTKVPYVLQEGEGERLVAADQVFSFLQTQASSGDTSITVMTEGPAGQAIPEHYHQEHTENFFCLDGLMTMWVNGQEVKLYPGDYMQVPALNIHSYRLDAPYTRFLGWLTPGIFEPFFRLVGDSYQGHVFPLDPPPFRFDRVLAHINEIDLHVVNPPK